MQPEYSWVAKFNGDRDKMCGVYAIHIFTDNEGIERSDENGDDEDENSFVSKDN